MYTRGQFAIIGKVSVKALRYYDEINLLKPFYIDENNQYKYYSNEQIDDIIFINELKGFGLTLEEIKNVMRKDSSRIKKQLEERIYKLRQEMQQNQITQGLILNKINELGKTPTTIGNAENKYEIEMVSLDEIVVVSSRDKIAIREVGRLIGKVYETIAVHKLKPVDSHMLIYHDNEFDCENEFDPENADIEVCVPVNQEYKECEELKGGEGNKEGKKEIKDNFNTKVIRSGNYIMTKHKGGFSSVGKAHASIIDYVKENGLNIEGYPFEKYISGNNTFFNPLEMEIQVYYPMRTV